MPDRGMHSVRRGIPWILSWLDGFFVVFIIVAPRRRVNGK